jgi:non-specific serine/threonine protein kinase/serine/threonine-protein kinase
MSDDADSAISEHHAGFSPRTDHPVQIGPYRIVRVLGEGGMGIVYEAADTGPVKRHVALKVVRGAINSRGVRARFEAERQALALMDHAGIAKVLQAGETEAGEPYFAMELVKGMPITDYCDARRLSTRERLELFIAVCQAVQHAHQKGVIHRDLKPSNVLVTEQDGKPVPKIIDFGIAKALGLQLTDITLVTQVGQPLGTVAYMSPEQAESSGMDVDTRSDIYSLGVILYSMLVGSLPVDPTEVPVHAFLYRLASKDVRNPRPSARFTSLGDYRQGIAQARKTDPDHLQRDLKGDLDWIVMKALEPDRSRRYETAIGLAGDIERYLEHMPVTARQPTAAYRIGKFVRRHRAAVTASTLAAILLIGSTILTAVNLVRARRAERVAASEAAAAKQVSDFLVDLFKVSDPSEARGNDVTARELLDKGAEKSRAGLAAQPALQSRMMYTIGTAYASLGLYEAARTQLEQALDARMRTFGPSAVETAETEFALADAFAGHGEAADADRHYANALAIRERAFGPNDPRVGKVLAGIAGLRQTQGKLDEAETLYKRAIGIFEASADSIALAQELSNIGIVYWAKQRYADAENAMRRSLALQRSRLGTDHPDLASVMNNLGGLLWSQGKYGEALPLYDQTRKIFEKTLDPMHPRMASILNNLGETYWKLGRYHEADSLFRRALVIKEARLARGNPSIAVTLNGLAGSLRDQGKYAESEAAYRRALDIRRRAFGSGDPNVAETIKDYSELLRRMGRTREASALSAGL